MNNHSPIPSFSSTQLESTLTTHFGISSFRPLQRDVIECVLAGNSALAVLPTGGGKSLCYQLPAMLVSGITLVVSPLISLMKDQVDALVARGIPAVAINSQDTYAEMKRKLADIEAGQVRIVYVAPERLQNGAFIETCHRVRISILAVDEAHCVSQWGHDFRPDYRFIKDFRASVGEPPLLALTATATPKVQVDVAQHLGIAQAQRFLAGVDRPNLWLGLESCATMAEKNGKVAALAARTQGSVIVYVSSRKDADELAAMLSNTLGELVAAYHAGMAPDARTSVQNRFMTGMVRIVTATNAFGMGIDKADIRAVIHAGVPESIEAYYQEVGRAGRDGEPAECTMVVVPGRDVKLRQLLLEKDEPTRGQVDKLLREVNRIAQSGEGVVSFTDAEASMGTLILSYLQTKGQLELTQRIQSGMRITAVRPLALSVMQDIWTQVQHQAQVKRQRFTAMRNFIYLDSCRRSFLMSYFGEQSLHKPDACCSVCNPKPVLAIDIKKSPVHKAKQLLPTKAQASVNPELLQLLRTWRKNEAEMRDVPAYVVFGDKDLAGIAAAMPVDCSELAACRGVGPTKLAMYGEDIIRIVDKVRTNQSKVVAAAAELFAAGRTVSDVAIELDREETLVWDYFLSWIIETQSEVWKEQVRRVLSPDVYIAIRGELRAWSHVPFSTVLNSLQKQFNYYEITLTRAVMERVGELNQTTS